MSLRIVPSPSHPSSTTSERGAPSAPGLPDTLRSTTTQSATSSASSSHPLESRLTQWTATQQSLKHTLLARTYGIAEPLRRDMELKIVRSADGFTPAVLCRGVSVSDDILSGRDCEIAWEDVFPGQDGVGMSGGAGGDGQGVKVLEEMERKVGMSSW